MGGSTAPILSLLGLEPTATYASDNQGDGNDDERQNVADSTRGYAAFLRANIITRR